jgi:hypothetical protein
VIVTDTYSTNRTASVTHPESYIQLATGSPISTLVLALIMVATGGHCLLAVFKLL